MWNSSIHVVKKLPPYFKIDLAFFSMPTAQVPEPVVVPPFEATGLNDDIWADVHKEMAEVAEVLNSVNNSKSEEQASSSTAKRHTGVGR